MPEVRATNRTNHYTWHKYENFLSMNAVLLLRYLFQLPRVSGGAGAKAMLVSFLLPLVIPPVECSPVVCLLSICVSPSSLNHTDSYTEHQSVGVTGAPRLAGNPSNIRSWIVCDAVNDLWLKNDCTVASPVSEEFPEFPFVVSHLPPPFGNSLAPPTWLAYRITRSML